MHLSDYIEKNRPILQKHIDTVLEKKKQTVSVKLVFFHDVIKRLQKFVPQGKLLRGIQILLAYEMCNGRPSKDILNAAAAIELFQSAAVIHDDIMDNDTTRRGKPSIFAQYMDEAREARVKNSLLYGQAMGICVGDIGMFFAFELLTQSSVDTTIMQKVIKHFAHENQLVGAAQMMDMDFGSRDTEPSEEQIIQLYTYKTARYSFSLPLTTGAMVAGAEEIIVKQLDTLGELLGVIFQIKDDELGLLGTENETGKPIGSDIRENKKTIFRSYLLKRVSSVEKNRLNKIFGSPKITEQNIEYIKTLIEQYRVQEQIKEKMNTMKNNILVIVDQLPIEENYKNLLREFTSYIANRSR